jgi:hypothetical protein
LVAEERIESSVMGKTVVWKEGGETGRGERVTAS